MKILVLCGDYWHPPEVARAGLGALSEADFEFDWVEDCGSWDPKAMSSYPLVILAKSNNLSRTDRTEWMTDHVQSVFSDHVHRGNSLLAVHSGTAEYDQKSVLRGLLGGVFLHHPEQCLVTMTPEMEHPLCSGSVSFTAKDEHYFMALDDTQADVFMMTRSVNGEQPGAWRRTVGRGRVVVLTPGHNLDVWLDASFQALLRNSIAWCGRLI